MPEKEKKRNSLSEISEKESEELIDFFTSVQEKHGNISAMWTFQEYEKHSRGKWWHILIIGFSVLLIGYGVLTSNMLFAMIIVIADIIIFLHAKNEPHDLIFAITEDGILIQHQFIPHKQIQHFWIAYHPPIVKKIYFQKKSSILPPLSIPLEDQNPLEIRKLLLKFIDEHREREDETTSEALNRLLKL